MGPEGIVDNLKTLCATVAVAAVVFVSGAAHAKPPTSVNCGAQGNDVLAKAVDAANPGDTIFLFGGTCEEDVTITKDDITLSGNQESHACNKADPSASADAAIDGTVTVDGVRANIEFLEITGAGDGVLITNRADARLTCNDISGNDASGVLVRRTSNAVLIENTVSDNGQRSMANPNIYFDSGLLAREASSVASFGNTYTGNQYAAISVQRLAVFRNSIFLPREVGHPPVADHKDVIVERGADPNNAASCQSPGAPWAVSLFTGGMADLRHADICGGAAVSTNSMLRIDDGGGAIKGVFSAGVDSLVRIKDRSNLGNGRLTTFDGTLFCSGGSQTFGSDVQCGQTCSGAIPGSCTP